MREAMSMKDPLNTAISIESCLSARGQNIKKMSRTDPKKSNDFISFVAILSDKNNSIKNVDSLNDESSPLQKDHLQRLVNAIKTQMNNYLFHELSNVDEDGCFTEFHGEWLNFRGIDSHEGSHVSKVKHAHKQKEIEATPNIDEIISHASKIHEVDPELIKAVIRAESNFDANSTSSKGAMGLMQLMPQTAKDLGVKNCYNPAENIMAGTCYLKSLLKRYDQNVDLTLAAYNWGMGNVERHPDRLPQETRTYIARVNEYLQQ